MSFSHTMLRAYHKDGFALIRQWQGTDSGIIVLALSLLRSACNAGVLGGIQWGKNVSSVQCYWCNSLFSVSFKASHIRCSEILKILNQ